MLDGNAERAMAELDGEAAAEAANRTDFKALLDVLAALEAEFGQVFRARSAHAE